MTNRLPSIGWVTRICWLGSFHVTSHRSRSPRRSRGRHSRPRVVGEVSPRQETGGGERGELHRLPPLGRHSSKARMSSHRGVLKLKVSWEPETNAPEWLETRVPTVDFLTSRDLLSNQIGSTRMSTISQVSQLTPMATVSTGNQHRSSFALEALARDLRGIGLHS